MNTANLAVMIPEPVTAKWLTDLGACSSSREEFLRLYPTGVKPSLAVLTSGKEFHINWLARQILTPAAQAAYIEAAAAALKAYHEEEESAYKVSDESLEAALKAYHESTTLSRKAYDEATAPSWKVYIEVIGAAWKAYGEAKAAALWALVE